MRASLLIVVLAASTLSSAPASAGFWSDLLGFFHPCPYIQNRS